MTRLPDPEARSWAVVIAAALGKLWPVDPQSPKGPWQCRRRNVKAAARQDSKLAACRPVFSLPQSGCSVPSNEDMLPDVILVVTRR